MHWTMDFMMLDILKGLLIGICASVPLGPIAILVLQKSLSEGHRAGFMAGLGACLVDTLYAVIAMFALAFAESFIEDHRILIMVGGGIIVILLGCSMAFKDPFRKMKEEHQTPSYSLKDFFQAVIMGISNPGAIFVIFALFAFFGIQLEPHDSAVPQRWFRPVLVFVLVGLQPFSQELQAQYFALAQQGGGSDCDYHWHCTCRGGSA